MKNDIITLKQLKVRIQKTNQPLIKGIDLTIPKGKIVGVVGESGSGKSLTMKSMLSILPDTLVASWDHFLFEDKPVLANEKLPIAMIFQDPMTSLNPLRTIGYHLIEVIRRFRGVSNEKAYELAVQELEKVGIQQASERMKQYPHELSGGMRQRVMIAMAMVTQSKVLIADEPTTALDVTIQAQILSTIRQLQETEELTVILVTHDFGVVASLCDTIVVMHGGMIVEKGTAEDILYHAEHPYTKQLLQVAALGKKEDTLTIVDYEATESALIEKKLSSTHSVFLEGEHHE